MTICENPRVKNCYYHHNPVRNCGFIVILHNAKWIWLYKQNGVRFANGEADTLNNAVREACVHMHGEPIAVKQ